MIDFYVDFNVPTFSEKYSIRILNRLRRLKNEKFIQLLG